MQQPESFVLASAVQDKTKRLIVANRFQLAVQRVLARARTC